jgi:hypothetical protein
LAGAGDHRLTGGRDQHLLCGDADTLMFGSAEDSGKNTNGDV